MANPPTLLINVTAPGTLGLPSYTDVKLNATSAQYGAIGTLYDAWCVDRSTLIDVPGNYTAYLYSSYELGLLALNLPNIGNQVSPYVASANLDKLDSVNWLANEWKVNHSALVSQGYTYGDVQQAIYTLLGDGLSTNPDLGPFDTARVTQLADAASTTGNGFVPRTDQYISVILDPVNSSGVHQQPLIIQTLAAQLGNFVWLDANANGAQDGPLVVSCGTPQSESLVVVEPGGHVGRLHLSLSTCPRGGCQEHGNERWSGGAVHQRVGPAATVGG